MSGRLRADLAAIVLAGVALLGVTVVPQDAGAVVIALAAVALVATVGVRLLMIVLIASMATEGEQPRRSGEVLTESVAPRHPNTEGRPRTRAPAGRIAPA